jgi:hypothetical protein
MAPAVRTLIDFGLRLCLPAAPVLPIGDNEKFGTFSFYGQLSDKLSDLPSGTKVQRLRTTRQKNGAVIYCECSGPELAQAV